jgi:hypothetical protein
MKYEVKGCSNFIKVAFQRKRCKYKVKSELFSKFSSKLSVGSETIKCSHAEVFESSFFKAKFSDRKA